MKPAENVSGWILRPRPALAATAKSRHAATLHVAGCREIEVMLVWRLDRWGRTGTDLLATVQELDHLCPFGKAA